SLLDSALAWMSYHLMGYEASGNVPGPQGSRLDILAPYEAFPVSDGWAMIAAATDTQFRALCVALDIPECVADERFATNALRVAHRDVLTDRISQTTKQFAREQLLERLRAAGVPCAPILSIDQVTQLEQVRENGMLLPGDDGCPTVALPIEVDGVRAGVRYQPPRLGEH